MDLNLSASGEGIRASHVSRPAEASGTAAKAGVGLRRGADNVRGRLAATIESTLV